MGILLMRIEEWGEAAKEFRTCLELRNNNRKDLVFLARALIESGEDAGALEFARRAHELLPEDVDAMVLLGSLSARSRHPEEALGWFDRAIERAPTLGAAHLRRGNVLAQLGQRTSAVTALTRACELLPGSFEAHFNLVLLLLDSDEPERGVPYFMVAYRLRPPDFTNKMREAAVAIHRDDVTTLVMLATIDADRDDLTTAKSWIERALEISPKDGPSNYIYGVLLRKLEEDPLRALGPLQLAAEKLPTSYHAQMDLADLLLQLNREADAEPHLAKALLLLPEQRLEPLVEAKIRETIETALRKIDAMEVGPLPSDG
jgi:tetratricopeptide (TPR) repeat protein